MTHVGSSDGRSDRLGTRRGGVSEGRGGDGGGGESLLDQPDTRARGKNKREEEKREGGREGRREGEVKFGRGSFTLITRIKVRREGGGTGSGPSRAGV